MKKVLFTSHVANFVKFNHPFMDLLKEEGYEVHYASMGEEPIECDRHFTIPFERSPFKLNNLKAIWQLKKIIDREGYDIIHTHTPMGSVVTRIAAMRARKKGTRVVYTAHGFHFFKGSSMLNWVIFYPIEKWLAKYTDILITINQEDYELAKNKFKSDVRYVAGVGIDPKRFDLKMTSREKTDLRRSLGLEEDDFVMIYPAELSKRKNQVWLINTLASQLVENKSMHLLLPGKDSLNGECQRLSHRLNIVNQVHFLGYRRDVGKLLRISNIALSSSKQEGLPVNILEAMYAGLPIVMTDCRGNRDLASDIESCVLVGSGDNKAFIQAISRSRSLQIPILVDKITAQRYSITSIIKQMKKVYLESHE